MTNIINSFQFAGKMRFLSSIHNALLDRESRASATDSDPSLNVINAIQLVG
jgi:hypothetical protein